MRRCSFLKSIVGDCSHHVRIGGIYETVDLRLHTRGAALGRRHRAGSRPVALQLPLVRRVSSTRGAVMLLEQLRAVHGEDENGPRVLHKEPRIQRPGTRGRWAPSQTVGASVSRMVLIAIQCSMLWLVVLASGGLLSLVSAGMPSR
jgi:hypothetical protein